MFFSCQVFQEFSELFIIYIILPDTFGIIKTFTAIVGKYRQGGRDRDRGRDADTDRDRDRDRDSNKL